MTSVADQNSHSTRSIAVIPARGGSVRIPRKNLADFGGQPAISHVVELARQSGVFEKILVSTNDADIAQVAKDAGADVVWRPENLSDGMTPLLPVVTHAMETSGEHDLVCLILATAILLNPQRLRDAHQMLSEDPSLDYVIGIKRFDSAPQRAMTRNDDGLVAMQSPENFNVRSQDLTPLFHDAGQFSFGRRAAWLSGKPSFTMRTHGIELPRAEAVDIDEPEDLTFAQLLFEAQKLK